MATQSFHFDTPKKMRARNDRAALTQGIFNLLGGAMQGYQGFQDRRSARRLATETGLPEREVRGSDRGALLTLLAEQRGAANDPIANARLEAERARRAYYENRGASAASGLGANVSVGARTTGQDLLNEYQELEKAKAKLDEGIYNEFTEEFVMPYPPEYIAARKKAIEERQAKIRPHIDRLMGDLSPFYEAAPAASQVAPRQTARHIHGADGSEPPPPKPAPVQVDPDAIPDHEIEAAIQEIEASAAPQPPRGMMDHVPQPARNYLQNQLPAQVGAGAARSLMDLFGSSAPPPPPRVPAMGNLPFRLEDDYFNEGASLSEGLGDPLFHPDQQPPPIEALLSRYGIDMGQGTEADMQRAKMEALRARLRGG